MSIVLWRSVYSVASSACGVSTAAVERDSILTSNTCLILGFVLFEDVKSRVKLYVLGTAAEEMILLLLPKV